MKKLQPEEVKSQLINTLLKWLIFFLIIYNIIQTTYIGLIGIQPELLYSYIGLALLLTVYLFRDRLNYKLKGHVYIYFIFLLSIITFLNYGVFSGGPLWLILASIFSSLILSKRMTFWISGVGIFLAVGFFILHDLDVITLNFNVYDLEKSFNFGGVFLLEAGFVVFNIFYGYESLYKFLLDNQKELEKRNEELIELNLKLENEIDIKKGIELDLKKSEKLFKSIFFAAGDGTFLYQHDKMIDCNEKALKLFGATKEQLLKLYPWSISPEFQPDGVSSEKKGLKITSETLEGNPIQFEWKHKKMNGELFDAEVSYNVVNYEKGMYLAIVRDITERKYAEKILKESEDRYRRLADATFEAVIVSKDAVILDVNKQVETIYGYNQEELIQKTFADIVHPDDLELVLYNIKYKITKPYIHRGLKKDGSVIFMETTGKYFKVGNQENRLSILRDITKYKHAEQAILKSENRFRNIFNSVFDALVIFDYNGNFLEINEVAMSLLGYSREEYLTMNVKDIVAPEYHNKLFEFRNEALLSKSKIDEIEYVTKSGNMKFAEITSRKTEFDKKNAFIVVSRDVTSKKQMQKNLIYAKIESEENERERYAKELHDGLGPILSTCKIYFYKANLMTYGEEFMEHVRRAGELLEDAIQGIKEISNNLSPHVLRDFGLTEALYSFTDKLKTVVSVKISIESDFKDRLLDAIESTLYRTLVELLNNSLKYSQATIIKIKILNVDYDLHITFSDNGIGLDYESIKKERRGFGLLNLENRIKEIGGEYNFISLPGKGVVVNIVLKYIDSWLE